MPVFHQFGEIFWHSFLKYFFSPTPFSSSYGAPWIWMLDAFYCLTEPWGSGLLERLCTFCFGLFSLWFRRSKCYWSVFSSTLSSLLYYWVFIMRFFFSLVNIVSVLQFQYLFFIHAISLLRCSVLLFQDHLSLIIEAFLCQLL